MILGRRFAALRRYATKVSLLSGQQVRSFLIGDMAQMSPGIHRRNLHLHEYQSQNLLKEVRHLSPPIVSDKTPDFELTGRDTYSSRDYRTNSGRDERSHRIPWSVVHLRETTRN